MSREKNIDEHNKDVEDTGHYLYSDPHCLSASTSIKRIQETLADLILTHVAGDQNGKRAPKLSILDVGCGDGISTIDIAKRVKPTRMLGIEPAQAAIAAAKKNNTLKNVDFKVGDAYKITFKKGEFDIVMIRSVLHHLYQPERAIHHVAPFGRYILIMEPNGYNPLLKIIEKISPYHRAHEERSFFPPTVHKWVRKQGFELVESRYINLVPTFAPSWSVPIFKALEPVVEALPVVKHLLCAQNVTLWKYKT